MSLEFTVEYPCVLRARYPEKHLRDWGRLSNLHTILTTVDQSAPTPDKIAWIENAGSEIDRLQTKPPSAPTVPRVAARRCRRRRAVGCLGRIKLSDRRSV